MLLARVSKFLNSMLRGFYVYIVLDPDGQRSKSKNGGKNDRTASSLSSLQLSLPPPLLPVGIFATPRTPPQKKGRMKETAARLERRR